MNEARVGSRKKVRYWYLVVSGTGGVPPGTGWYHTVSRSLLKK